MKKQLTLLFVGFAMSCVPPGGKSGTGGTSSTGGSGTGGSIDTTAPTVAIDMKPSATQPNSRGSTFSFTCNETPCTFECAVDSTTAYSACTQMVTFERLSVGQHTLNVRGKDAANNTSAVVSHSWALTFGWRSAATNGNTACAVSGAGNLYCWGSGTYGMLGQGGTSQESSKLSHPKPQIVGGDSDWAIVFSGQYIMCARKAAGATFCWGSNYQGMFGDPAVAKDMIFTSPTAVSIQFKTLAFGEGFSCGLKDGGELYCWGQGEYGRLGDGDTQPHFVATPTRVGSALWKSISLRTQACAVRSDGSLWCWGENQSGETGSDAMLVSEQGNPTQVGGETDWAEVSAGSSFTCARKTNGKLYCFGSNGYGVLGNSVATETHVVTQIGTATNWSTLEAFDDGVCAVNSQNIASCWGSTENGGIGSVVNSETVTAPVPVSTNVLIRQMVPGRSALRCAFTLDDGMLCWGENVIANGGLGRNVRGNEETPVAIDMGYQSLAVTSNDYGGLARGACAIKSDGKLYCWGIGRHVGTGTSFLSYSPVELMPSGGWSQIDMTRTSTPLVGNGSSTPNPVGHACGIRGTELYCWGANGSGQLGLGNTNSVTVPTQVPPPASETWAKVTVGDLSTCAMTTSQKLYCWGYNQQGQVGDGTNQQRNAPVQVGSQTDWTQVAINGGHVAGRRANGTLWAWGQIEGNTPVQIGSATDWAEGAPGSNYTCGRKQDGTLFCKMLGVTSPVQVGTHTDVLKLLGCQIANICFIDNKNNVKCYNYQGNAFTVANYPVQPSGEWKDFAFAGQFACGLKADGARHCQGVRFAGSFGDGFDERIPAAVMVP